MIHEIEQLLAVCSDGWRVAEMDLAGIISPVKMSGVPGP